MKRREYKFSHNNKEKLHIKRATEFEEYDKHKNDKNTEFLSIVFSYL